jgi:hypothetical protein
LSFVFNISDSYTEFRSDGYWHLLHFAWLKNGHLCAGITQRRGGTQTHKALADMREKMFSPAHSRSTAAHVAIVITDGESEEPEETAREANLAHLAGIQARIAHRFVTVMY